MNEPVYRIDEQPNITRRRERRLYVPMGEKGRNRVLVSLGGVV